MSKTLPKKDPEFDEIQKVIVDTSTASVTEWKLDNDWLTGTVMPAKIQWDLKYGAYKNPANRTPIITKAKNDARVFYEPILSRLVKILSVNPAVTVDDLRSMNIYVPSSQRTPTPVPTSYPDFTLDSSMHRRITVHFRDHDSTSNAKPRGVNGAAIAWGFASGDTVSESDLTNSAFSTRTPHAIDFTEEQRGKMVYFRLRWENTKAEPGLWSDIEGTIVP